MTTSAERLTPRASLTSAEVGLLVVALLSPALLAIQWGDVYSGLPAHPLLVHVPVVLIPIAAIAAIALMIRPAWLDQWGIPAGIVALAGLGGTFLAAGSGEALRAALPFPERTSQLVNDHAEAADLLRTLAFAFVIALTVAIVVRASARGRLWLPGALAHLAARRWAWMGLRIIVVLLALTCLVVVIRVGDLGAKAVWEEQNALIGGLGAGT